MYQDSNMLASIRKVEAAREENAKLDPRRMTAEEKETLVVGELSIHLPSLSVALSGHKLNLTRREVELLYTLASAPGRVFTRG